jgi:pyroglutamyl-peptidase
MSMRLLIYGFGPYREFPENITEKILRKFPRKTGLKKIVFPVRFHKGQFISAVKRHKPNVILGLGQCSGGRRLRIEAQAINRRRNNHNEEGRPIMAGEPSRLRTNLKLALGRQAKASNTAGDYVCNYSMYVMLDFIKRRRLPIRFGFIHIPQRYDDKKAMRLLNKAVGKIEAANRKGLFSGPHQADQTLRYHRHQSL